MSVEERDYKLEVLEYGVNHCVDRLLPCSSEDALSVILYQSNELVWRVATEIYTKSGHQVDFSFIRDTLNLRVEPLQRKIAEEAELKAQRLAKIAENERIRQEKEAELARIRVELEAERLAKETEEQKRLQEYEEVNQELSTCEIFEKTKSIIVEQLEVEPDQVTSEANIMFYLGADDQDSLELIMALEEEFDIEISDEFLGYGWSWESTCPYSRLNPVTVKQIVDIVCEKYNIKID